MSSRSIRSSRSSGSIKSSRSSRNNDREKPRVPARGRRFSPEQHAHALSLIAAGMKRDEVATAVGCTTESLRRWCKEAKRKGQAVVDGGAARADTGTSPAASSAPHDPGAGLGEHETKAILDYKKKHPSMGPAQIRAQLKRFLGWRVSVKAIARVLRKAGFPTVHGKGRPTGNEHPGRFEAPRIYELPDIGSGNGKAIDYRAQTAISYRAHAQGAVLAASITAG